MRHTSKHTTEKTKPRATSSDKSTNKFAVSLACLVTTAFFLHLAPVLCHSKTNF